MPSTLEQHFISNNIKPDDKIIAWADEALELALKICPAETNEVISMMEKVKHIDLKIS